MANNTTSSAEERFFAEFYSNGDPAKLAVIAAGFAWNALVLVVLRAIVVYERRLPENRRTIIARMRSCACVVAGLQYPLNFFPRTILELTGPWPEDVCSLMMVVESTITSCTLGIMTLVVLLKAVFLFIVKNVWALNDDLLIVFFNIWLPLVTSYFSLGPMLLLPGKYPSYYVVCVGFDANAPFKHLSWDARGWFGKTTIILVMMLSYLISMVSISVKRYLDKRKGRKNPSEAAAAQAGSRSAESARHKVLKRIANIVLVATFLRLAAVGRKFYKVTVGSMDPLLIHMHMSLYPGTTMLVVIGIFLLHTEDAAAEV